MKRILHVLFAVLLFGITANSQIIYQQNFDSFTPGDHLAVVDPNWTTWSNAPGSAEDPLISNAQSVSPSNSVVIQGTNDAVFPIANYTAGYYKMSFRMYVPTGRNGYFNLLQLFNGASSEWGMQVFFDTGGNGSIDGGAQTAATFTYSYNTWMLIENYIDLTNDWAEFYIDGNLIHGWIWSSGTFGTGTLNQLGGMNMYAWSDNGPCTYYVDNVVFEEAQTPLYADDFESYNVGQFLAVENPTWWTTWSNLPGSSEDAPITDVMAHSGTKSVLVQGSTDAILKLGDQTSGQYTLTFYYYIPTGFGGYYNIQHYESPGVEWAYEVYFGAAGNGELHAELSSPITFTYTKNQWIYIENIIDLDNDWTQLYIEGTLIHEWQFSTQAGGGAGTKQLGGMDLFAGALTGETPRFYMDDMTFSGGGGVGNAIIGVAPVLLTEELQAGETSTQMLTISNTGEQDLTYDIFITFDGGPTLAPIPGNVQKKEIMLELSQPGSIITNGGGPAPSDDVILNYDGDNFSAIGLTGGGEMKCAAMFPVTMVNPYVGMELTSVELYINDMPNSAKLLIYDFGMPNLPGPGQLIYEQVFTPVSESWNTVTLTTPVMVTGGDFWVGYSTDHAGGIFPSGVDEGPAVFNGDWISTGPGWHHLSDNTALDYNWNIRAHLTGNPTTQWLNVSSTTGTVAVNGSTDIDVNFDATGLAAGTYNATIVVWNNDPNNPSVEVPVTLVVTAGYEVSLKVYLEGPFATGQMNAFLSGMPEFPLVQPYNTAPWNYTGSESIASVPNPDIVDWILVELRDAANAANATGATMIEQQAGFVLKDGTVVSTDGSSPMNFTTEVTQQLFAVVNHRNHLDIMSANPLTPGVNSYSYDFTTGANQVYGGALGHKQLDTGIWGMTGGDGLPDGQVGNSDKVDVWVPQSGSSGYYFGDFSLDGQVNNLDKVEVWTPNGGSGSQVPQ